MVEAPRCKRGEVGSIPALLEKKDKKKTALFFLFINMAGL